MGERGTRNTRCCDAGPHFRRASGRVPGHSSRHGWPMNLPVLHRPVLLLACVLLVVAPDGAPAAPASPASLATLTVRDDQGAAVRPFAGAGEPQLFLFLLHDCPAANAYAPEINRIVAAYPRVRTRVVYVESDLTPATARAHARDYRLTCGILLDPEQRLARVAGVTISPEAALFSAGGELLYRGRIDDRVAEPGKRRPEPTRRDLRLALDAVLAGKPVPEPRTRAIGCYLPELPSVPSTSPPKPATP